MVATETEVYTTEQLKEKLGNYYLTKVLAKCDGVTKKQLRTVLAGQASSIKLINRCMRAAKVAIAEQEELKTLNARIVRREVA